MTRFGPTTQGKKIGRPDSGGGAVGRHTPIPGSRGDAPVRSLVWAAESPRGLAHMVESVGGTLKPGSVCAYWPDEWSVVARPDDDRRCRACVKMAGATGLSIAS